MKEIQVDTQVIVDLLYYFVIGTRGFLNENRRIKDELRHKFEDPNFFVKGILIHSPLEIEEIRAEMGDTKFFEWAYNVSNMLKNKLRNEMYL